jgi:G3E family GTPase
MGRAAIWSEAAMSPVEQRALPFHVLTGFLGSGKTTLLNALLRTPRFADALVLINEFGEVPIDHLLVRDAREELVVLASGCVCCTLRADLVEQLGTLLAQRAAGQCPKFSRVVLETTGLADPAPIVQTLLKHPLLSDALFLDGIVCTVDGQLGRASLAGHSEAQKQVVIADRLLLTKVDLAMESELNELSERLRSLNPDASQLRVLHGQIDPSVLLDVGHLDTRSVAASSFGASTPQLHEHGPVQRFSAVIEQPLDFRGFSLWVSMLTQLWGARILRLKAVVSARGEPNPIAVQAVQHVVYPPLDLPPDPRLAGKSYVVVLARDLTYDERRELDAGLRALSAA